MTPHIIKYSQPISVRLLRDPVEYLSTVSIMIETAAVLGTVSHQENIETVVSVHLKVDLESQLCPLLMIPFHLFLVLRGKYPNKWPVVYKFSLNFR